MRSASVGVGVCCFILAVSGWCQQTSTTSPQVQPSATKDPQAVSVLTQALSAAGGMQAIGAITDYAVTGSITYHWNPEVEGNVTVRGLGLGEFRLDANLPFGVRSLAVQEGATTTKTEDGSILQFPPTHATPSSAAVPYQPPMFAASLALPYLQLTTLLNSTQFSLSYKGILQINGLSVHDVQVQRVFPGQAQIDDLAEYHTENIFLDTTTLQIAMVTDNISPHLVHRIQFANQKLVNGVLVPFSISEEIGGQPTWDLQVDQINFNTNLQDSDFVVSTGTSN